MQEGSLVDDTCTIYCYSGSAAETYAKENGIKYVLIDGDAVVEVPDSSDDTTTTAAEETTVTTTTTTATTAATTAATTTAATTAAKASTSNATDSNVNTGAGSALGITAFALAGAAGIVALKKRRK